MDRPDIIAHFDALKSAKHQWALAQTKHESDVTAVMTILLYEAARALMSVEDIAKFSGFTIKRIRSMMRAIDLNPRDGKTVLAKLAAEALATNASLMGIRVEDFDLMSPLAYLPMGAKLKRELQDSRVSQVHEVSGNIVLTDDEYDLAMKLSDAGPVPEDAVDWVQRILAARGVTA